MHADLLAKKAVLRISAGAAATALLRRAAAADFLRAVAHLMVSSFPLQYAIPRCGPRAGLRSSAGMDGFVSACTVAAALRVLTAFLALGSGPGRLHTSCTGLAFLRSCAPGRTRLAPQSTARGVQCSAGRCVTHAKDGPRMAPGRDARRLAFIPCARKFDCVGRSLCFCMAPRCRCSPCLLFRSPTHRRRQRCRPLARLRWGQMQWVNFGERAGGRLDRI